MTGITAKLIVCLMLEKLKNVMDVTLAATLILSLSEMQSSAVKDSTPYGFIRITVANGKQ